MKNRTQLWNPRFNEWVKLNTKTGRIIGVKKKPWKSVPFYKNQPFRELSVQFVSVLLNFFK